MLWTSTLFFTAALWFAGGCNAQQSQQPPVAAVYAHYPLLDGSLQDVAGNTVLTFNQPHPSSRCPPAFMIDNVPGLGAASVFSSRCDGLFGGGMTINGDVLWLNTELTLSALFRWNSNSTSNATYVFGGDGLFLAFYPTSTTENLWLRFGSAIYTFGVCFADDAWIHVVITHDAAETLLYIDGQPQSASSVLTAPAADTTTLVLGGADNGWQPSPIGNLSSIAQFNGEITHVLVQAERLTPRQAELLYVSDTAMF